MGREGGAGTGLPLPGGGVGGSMGCGGEKGVGAASVAGGPVWGGGKGFGAGGGIIMCYGPVLLFTQVRIRIM